MKYINLTPHTIKLNDGRVYTSEGKARVTSSYTDFVDDCCKVTFGEVTGLPEPQEGVRYIVSAILANACPDRKDLVAPATGHPECIRVKEGPDKGQIISVPGFVTLNK